MPSKLRFAPSPTGNLHIGSVRTAIFNWVWARSLGAKLVLRIEDTDMERSKPEFEANIMDGLKWLDLQFDEGPNHPNGNMKYRQSERIKDSVYTPHIAKLIASGNAYYCFETDEELAEERKSAEAMGVPYKYSGRSLNYTPDEVAKKLSKGVPHAIRFKVPTDASIVVNDAIRGNITFDSSLLSDFIIVKSDGVPTYNFAVVIDDVDMGITHVVRGEDHISNTPKQIMIYHALGCPVPTFAHLPIILGQDRSKLSKRHGAKSVTEYRDEGFLPEALINYLSLLGWSPPNEKEFFNRTELCDLFDIAKINKAGAVFDTVKLTWMNKQYLAKQTDADILALIHPYVSDQLKKINDLDKKIISVRDNIETLSQINHYLGVYTQTNQQVIEKFQQFEVSKTDCQVINFISRELNHISTWNRGAVDVLINLAMMKLSLGKGKVMKPVRKAMTGEESGPNLVDCLALIPFEDIKQRVEMVNQYVNSTTSN